MITILIIGLIGALGYALWRADRNDSTGTSQGITKKTALWILAGILSVLLLIHPKTKNWVSGLRRKYNL